MRHGSARAHTELREQLEASPILLAKGSDYVLHAVLDFARDEGERTVKAAMQEQSLIAYPIASYGDRIGAMLFVIQQTLNRLRRVGATDSFGHAVLARSSTRGDHETAAFPDDTLAVASSLAVCGSMTWAVPALRSMAATTAPSADRATTDQPG